MKLALPFLMLLLLLIACQDPQPTPKQTSVPTVTNEATLLLQEMVASLGGLDAYNALDDVTYTYTYRDILKDVKDVSTEKYLYDGELSWAEYHEHKKNVHPDKEGPVTESWNGKEAWLIVEGNFVPAPPALKMVNFSRNTSFFWFNMMYKLLDEGTLHEQLPNRELEGVDYQIVQVTYEEGVGDAQDRFVLYINPKTNLVDHFIFSNAFFGPKVPPRMMHVEYQTVNGLQWPKRQWYEFADWDGNIKEGPKSEKIYTDIVFNTGIERSLFDKPILTNIPMRDLRNKALKNGITPEMKAKGKELIGQLEAASGGYEKWSSYETATFTQTADWYENETNWTVNPQEFSMTCKIGSSDGKLSLLNGPKKGSAWEVRDGQVYGTSGALDPENQEMVWHKQSYKSYWFQFPFQMRSADFLAHGGKRTIEGVDYDIVYATWHSESPNSKYDQYMLYLHPDTHLLEYLEFTLRDRHPMAGGISRFDKFEEHGGLTVPMSQYITMGSLDRPDKKLHENHYQTVVFE